MGTNYYLAHKGAHEAYVAFTKSTSPLHGGDIFPCDELSLATYHVCKQSGPSTFLFQGYLPAHDPRNTGHCAAVYSETPFLPPEGVHDLETWKEILENLPDYMIVVDEYDVEISANDLLDRWSKGTFPDRYAKDHVARGFDNFLDPSSQARFTYRRFS